MEVFTLLLPISDIIIILYYDFDVKIGSLIKLNKK
jgi:hypothetical protein